MAGAPPQPLVAFLCCSVRTCEEPGESRTSSAGTGVALGRDHSDYNSATD